MQSYKMLVSNIKNSYRIKTKFGISIQKHFVPYRRYTLKALSLRRKEPLGSKEYLSYNTIYINWILVKRYITEKPLKKIVP